MHLTQSLGKVEAVQLRGIKKYRIPVPMEQKLIVVDIRKMIQHVTFQAKIRVNFKRNRSLDIFYIQGRFSYIKITIKA